MKPQPSTVDGDGKPHRCSCGSLFSLCNGEYHDCATERMVAHQERQTRALETIARMLSFAVAPTEPR